MSAAVLHRLLSLFPSERFLSQPEQLAAYESDALTAFQARPLAVVLPETADEVVALVRFCHDEKLPFVARGSGTSLSGGSLPVPGGIVIALNRLNRILRLDPALRLRLWSPVWSILRSRLPRQDTGYITRPTRRANQFAPLAATSR